jgi:predicted ATPase/class 3 adenylate cyclase
MTELPSGAVTFLFSDVEGSTQLLERHGARMGPALARHHELFEQTVSAHDGAIFETVGDAVYAAFAGPSDAVGAALDAQRALVAEDWGPIARLAVRIAIHTGEVERRGDHYFGPALFRCARLQAIGFGEQTLLSGLTARLVADALPEGTSLRDLGSHRLKDLGEPEQVFMLVHPNLRDEFPPLKSLDLHPNNLPMQLSSFVGRDREMEELSELIRDHRLVTLTGPGGIGKTRLALQVAARLIGDGVEGAFFVDLAPERDPEQIAQAVAHALGLRSPPGVQMADALAAHLGATQRILLILDNAEQIANAGLEALGLVTRSPELRVVVTSRGPLHVRGEQVLAVGPLLVDRPGRGAPDALASPAVTLFVDRASETLPSFTITEENAPTIATICARLDGLPLAIELAAPRVAIFEPITLLQRLERRLPLLTGGARDLPERQQTLRATIDWSYQLLGASDQAAFLRFAVFAGGSTLEAAESVCLTDADTLLRLADAALIRRSGARLRMLETVREFAAERAEEQGDAHKTLLRHALWFRDWVDRMQQSNAMRALESPEEFAAIAEERDNLNAAIAFFLAADDGESLRRMSLALWRYWMTHGQGALGHAWMSRAVQLSPMRDSAETAWLLGVLGEFPRFAGDPTRAIALKEQAIEMARRIGSNGIAATSLHDIASLWAQVGEFDRAEQAGLEALAIRREAGSPDGIAHALEAVAEVELRRGSWERARDLYEECAAQARVGSRGHALVFGILGVAEASRRLGDPPVAAARFAEAMKLARPWQDAMMDADALEGVGALLVQVGRGDVAVAGSGEDGGRAAVAAEGVTLLRAVDVLRQTNGLAVYDTDEHERTLTRARGSLTTDAFEAAWARGATLDAAEAVRLALQACEVLTETESAG